MKLEQFLSPSVRKQIRRVLLPTDKVELQVLSPRQLIQICWNPENWYRKLNPRQPHRVKLEGLAGFSEAVYLFPYSLVLVPENGAPRTVRLSSSGALKGAGWFKPHIYRRLQKKVLVELASYLLGLE